MTSPILFSLFINEFAELIEQSGLKDSVATRLSGTVPTDVR